MRWLVLVASIAALCTATFAANQPKHSVPKDRASLKDGDWFPFVLSKIAPLEWWTFEASTADVQRERYPHEMFYELAKQNTWEFPRFCFSFFRVSPAALGSLLTAIEQYSGKVIWQYHDDCIGASPTRWTFFPAVKPEEMQAMLEEAARNPPKADPEFVKRAVADIPSFCSYLEKRLNLGDVSPVDFKTEWLTKEGLAASKGEFEEFVEPGSWTVFLARDPEKYARTFQSTSPGDRPFSIGIGMFAWDTLFKELGADWNKYQEKGGIGFILPEYPLLSRLSDMTEDAMYEPDEIDRLLVEYRRAQERVKDPLSIRGLDELTRIARFAQKLKLGIYFGGQ